MQASDGREKIGIFRVELQRLDVEKQCLVQLARLSGRLRAGDGFAFAGNGKLRCKNHVAVGITEVLADGGHIAILGRRAGASAKQCQYAEKEKMPLCELTNHRNCLRATPAFNRLKWI